MFYILFSSLLIVRILIGTVTTKKRVIEALQQENLMSCAEPKIDSINGYPTCDMELKSSTIRSCWYKFTTDNQSHSVESVGIEVKGCLGCMVLTFKDSNLVQWNRLHIKHQEYSEGWHGGLQEVLFLVRKQVARLYPEFTR